MRYIVANWKMSLDLSQIVTWLNIFYKLTPIIPVDKTVILAPSTPYLGLLAELTRNKRTNLQLAAQNVSLLEKGAHTGESGAFQIKDFCKYCIVGHSELREPFEVSLEKRDVCIANALTPIVCFVRAEQGTSAYKDGSILTWEDPRNISSNGKYRAMPEEELKNGISKIKRAAPKEAVLIYGGSVNRQNIEKLAKITQLNGVLVGNASLDPAHFAEVVAKF